MGGEELALIGAAIAVGIGAALLPVFVNAEVYVVTMGATVDSKPFLAVLILIHVIATTIGKAFVFQLARRGTNKIRMVTPKPPRNRVMAVSRSLGHRLARTRLAKGIKKVSDWLLSLLDRPYSGGLTAFMSSLIGVPPLAIVTILAGASKQPQWLFLTMVFTGRLLQFLAIAFLLHEVSWF
ncbi:VTT domain-containing protein [Aeromicrobium sp. NPDC092404]|uniref:VTT domain-containing protein n=1 Tax=Aeromicrobium sp. NPDC092404 TaxID=3154976 RepID=UPI0034358F00